MLRDLYYENHKTLHHHDVLQVCVHGRNVPNGVVDGWMLSSPT